jgi:hypothetical protein
MKCKDGYFITGYHNTSCKGVNPLKKYTLIEKTTSGLECIDKLKCCQMVDTPPPPKNFEEIKTRVMEETLRPLAKLAFYLGYGWPLGCRADRGGEDFKRDGNSWVADTTEPCEGYEADQRLKIHYNNFKLETTDVKYGEPVIDKLKPQPQTNQVLDVTNDSSSPLKKSFTAIKKKVQSVTMTATSNWEMSNEVGISISYNAGLFGASADYKFSYTNGKSNSKEQGKQEETTEEISFTKEIPPYTSTKYRILLTKTRKTTPYTATIILNFSVEFEGFLRWGGGKDGDYTNYHKSMHM